MRQHLRNNRLKMRIVSLAVASLALQGCLMGTRSAEDYLPFSAQFLIDQDISAQQQGGERISVAQMLDRLTENTPPSDNNSSGAGNSDKSPIKSPMDTAQTQREKSKAPPQRIEIDLLQTSPTVLREQVMTAQSAEGQATATLIIGPVGHFDTAQQASWSALSKAHQIRENIDDLFSGVRMRFDPLTPRDTLRIIMTRTEG